MKPFCHAFFRRTEKSHVLGAILIAGGLTAGCGPQDPSFVEARSAQAVDPTQSTADSQAAKVEGKIPANGGGQSGDTSSGGSQANAESTTGGSGGSGSGSTGGTGGEEFGTLVWFDESTTQKATSNKVDILWIVDSSGSMSEEQTYLGQNFSSFISQLASSSIDFQTGVTTTDVCTGGNMDSVYCPTNGGGSGATHLQGSLVGTLGKRVLKPSTPDLASRFLNYAKVGVSGSGFEHGLTAAKMAVNKSLAGQNEGLVRNDAFLAVVVVSDEEDDGIGLGKTDAYSGMNYILKGLTSHKYTHLDFIADMKAAKGAGNFAVSAITGTKGANGKLCSSAHSQPQEEGTQYINAAKATGGIVQSICETNWSNSLATLGADIRGQSSQIVLAHKAYPPSIQVYVDHVKVTKWSFNSGNNAVKFDADAVPEPNQVIEVKYQGVP